MLKSMRIWGDVFKSPYTCTLCRIFSLDPSIVGLASSSTCWRKDKITSHTCVTWSAKILSFFSSCTIIKLFELGVEVALINRSVVTHNKVNLLKFPLRSSCSERTDTFVLLICFCFFHLWEPVFLVYWPFKFQNIHDLQSLIDSDPILSPAQETVCEGKCSIKVLPCVLIFLDWYCHFYFLCPFCQIFLDADS